MRNTYLILSILASLFSVNIHSTSPFSIRKINNKDGLSNNFIMDITQDSRGYIWIATEMGLNKFDGNKFTVYKTNNSGISSNELNCIMADPVKDILWIATQRDGLCAFDYATESFTSFTAVADDVDASVNTNDITDLKPSVDGGIWITTYHRGINHYNPNTGKFTHYYAHKIKELGGKQNWTAVDDSNGNLYVGHAGTGGMSIVSLKDFTCKNYRNNPEDPASLPGNEVRSIYKDKTGNVWVGTNNGLALFDPQTEKFITFKHVFGDNTSLLANNVFHISQTNDGKLWIGMGAGGISILDLSANLFLSPEKVHFQNITTSEDEYGVSNANVRCIYQDSFHNIWIGCYGGGVNFIGHEHPPFRIWRYSDIASAPDQLSGKQSKALLFNDREELLVGNNGSIDIYKDNTFSPLFSTISRKMGQRQIQALYEDPQKNLWIASNRNDILIRNNVTGNLKAVFPEPGQVSDVHCFYEDKDKKVWIGTQNGLYSSPDGLHFAEESVINDRLPDRMVRSIVRDEEGKLWIGTFGRGLCVFDTENKLKWNFVTDNGFCSNAISHLYLDSKSRMWVATRGGLVKFSTVSRAEYEMFNEDTGPENSHIRAVIEDGRGDIWISTDSGISRFRETDEKFDNFNHYDGLDLCDFMDGSVARGPDGTLYFGAQDGLCSFNPRDIPQNKFPAPIAITQICTYSKQSQSKETETVFPVYSGKVELPYTSNTFRVSYHILDFSQSRQVEYAYIMEGLENAWYTMQREDHVTFRNLAPGKYTFRVKARIRNQEWSDGTDSITIIIHPPLWLTWWAKTLYILVLLTIFYWGVRSYKRKLLLKSSLFIEQENHQKDRELNRERLRFYTNITHELRTPLTLILGPLEDLADDFSLSEKHIKKIKVIHQSASRLLELINRLLEFRKTETQNKRLSVCYDNIAQPVRETGLRFKELNQNPRVSVSVSVETEKVMLYFDPEIITTILNNLLSNALKYTSMGEVNISLRTVEEAGVSYAEIEVRDTGIGIAPENLPLIFDRYFRIEGEHPASGTGIGLALVKSMVELHEGSITVDSRENKGSSFRLRLQTDHTYPHAIHRKPEEKKKAEPESVESSSGQLPILLIVEDNPDILNYIAESFSDRYEIITALNGKEGCEKALKYIPDIIVSDIMMPEISGIELCKLLKEDMRTSHIPIILLTAKDSLPDKTEGYEAGADSYITKPFSAKLLLSRITNILENRAKSARVLFAHLPEEENPETVESIHPLDNEFLEKLTKIVEENMDAEKIDIAFIADKMCMSHSTLYRKIKGLTDMSAHEYIRRVKFRHAARLLLTGKYTISEIAGMIGFNSMTYFRQCFKEEFDCTPSEFIKKRSPTR